MEEMQSFREKLATQLKAERNYSYVFRADYSKITFYGGLPKSILGGYVNDPLRPHFVLVAHDIPKNSVILVIQCKATNASYVKKWLETHFAAYKYLKPLEALHHFSLPDYHPKAYGTYYTRGTKVYVSAEKPVLDVYPMPDHLTSYLTERKNEAMVKLNPPPKKEPNLTQLEFVVKDKP